MSNLKAAVRRSVMRPVEDRMSELERRVASLEATLEDSRRLNERLSDVLDVVVELLVPAVDRDDDKLKKGLDDLGRLI